MKHMYVVVGNTQEKSNKMCDLLLNKLPSTAFPGCWGNIKPLEETEEIKENVLKSISMTVNHYIKSSEYKTIIFGFDDHRQHVINNLLSRIETNECDIQTIHFNDVESLINMHKL